MDLQVVLSNRDLVSRILLSSSNKVLDMSALATQMWQGALSLIPVGRRVRGNIKECCMSISILRRRYTLTSLDLSSACCEGAMWSEWVTCCVVQTMAWELREQRH